MAEYVDNSPEVRYVNVAVQGCCHGELDQIYATIQQAEEKTGNKVDLLIICGDFQCVRNEADLNCVAVPPKYRKLNTFHQYVTGEKVAPVPTVFIGGNHEASNILQSLYHGGYVAPNIYFLGFAGVIRFKGLRIGGFSGIFNDRHYQMGHFEFPPYSDSHMRSVYHLREYEVFRMLHLTGRMASDPLDIFLSHDWPAGVWNYGDVNQLLRIKPYFAADMEKGELGSPPLWHILQTLQPDFWFSAHLHVKFAAIVPHNQQTYTAEPIKKNDEEIDIDDMQEDESTTPMSICSPQVPAKSTRFLALDKVIPGRGFMQFLQIPTTRSDYFDDHLHFDAEWLAIVRSTHQHLNTKYQKCTIPVEYDPVLDEHIQEISAALSNEFGAELIIPNIEPGIIECETCSVGSSQFLYNQGNMQTDRIINALQLEHKWTKPYTPPKTTVSTSNTTGESVVPAVDPNEIDI